MNHANNMRAAVLRSGKAHNRWRNPFVSNAMPAIMQLDTLLANGALDQPMVRMQLMLQLRLFRENLAEAGCAWDQIRDASYLLCTYIDEVMSDAARNSGQIPYNGDRSLLVELHDDAWGGENAFTDLERWMMRTDPPLHLLGFYELILSLGWQGRYRMLERGDGMLQDLRARLHALIWEHQMPLPLGVERDAPLVVRKRWWTTGKIVALLMTVLAIVWIVATIDLDGRGRSLRNGLAAWSPPVHTIDIAETLPQPLPKLLAEGWLTSYKHPKGWLLVFRSDGAFNVGKDIVRPEFQHNVDRLGRALAPWPGDLEVIGHTDSQPTRSNTATNQKLSETRAQNVAARLREAILAESEFSSPGSVTQRRIDFSGRGDTEPVDKSGTPAAFERNRRVDVLWKVLPDGTSRPDSNARTDEITRNGATNGSDDGRAVEVADAPVISESMPAETLTPAPNPILF